jgi:excisionase family DNA binding protein
MADASYLTTSQAAQRLGITRWGVRGLIRTGQLRATLHDTPRGPAYLIAPEDVERTKQLREAWPVQPGRKWMPSTAMLARLRATFPASEFGVFIETLLGVKPNRREYAQDLPRNVQIALNRSIAERYAIDVDDLLHRLRGLDMDEREALVWAVERYSKWFYESQMQQRSAPRPEQLLDDDCI